MRTTRLALVVVIATLSGAGSCGQNLYAIPEPGIPSPIDLEGRLCSAAPRPSLMRIWVLNLNLKVAPIVCEDEGACPFVENFRIDSDADAVPDDDEVTRGTDPFYPDSDYDRVTDGVELLLGRSPLEQDVPCEAGFADSDVDGVTDCDEEALGLDPNSFATNGDPDILATHDPLNAILYRVDDVGLVDDELCYDVTVRRVTLGELGGDSSSNHIVVVIEFRDVDTGELTYTASTRLVSFNAEGRPADGPIVLDRGAVDGIQIP